MRNWRGTLEKDRCLVDRKIKVPVMCGGRTEGHRMTRLKVRLQPIHGLASVTIFKHAILYLGQRLKNNEM